MSTEIKHDIEQKVSQEVVNETEVMSERKTENVVLESTLKVDIEVEKKLLKQKK